MTFDDTNHAATLALRALAWTLGEPARAERFLALTGLSPDDLRASAGSPSTLAAAIGFLESHEPDLVACADAIGAAPQDLAEARRRLDA